MGGENSFSVGNVFPAAGANKIGQSGRGGAAWSLSVQLWASIAAHGGEPVSMKASRPILLACAGGENSQPEPILGILSARRVPPPADNWACKLGRLGGVKHHWCAIACSKPFCWPAPVDPLLSLPPPSIYIYICIYY